jgi:hypothetical protein
MRPPSPGYGATGDARCRQVRGRGRVRAALATMQDLGNQGPSGFVRLCQTLELKNYDMRFTIYEPDCGTEYSRSFGQADGPAGHRPALRGRGDADNHQFPAFHINSQTFWIFFISTSDAITAVAGRAGRVFTDPMPDWQTNCRQDAGAPGPSPRVRRDAHRKKTAINSD